MPHLTGHFRRIRSIIISPSPDHESSSEPEEIPPPSRRRKGKGKQRARDVRPPKKPATTASTASMKHGSGLGPPNSSKPSAVPSGEIRRPRSHTPPEETPGRAQEKKKYIFKHSGPARCGLCQRSGQAHCFAINRNKATPYIACDYCRLKKTRCDRDPGQDQEVDSSNAETAGHAAPPPTLADEGSGTTGTSGGPRNFIRLSARLKLVGPKAKDVEKGAAVVGDAASTSQTKLATPRTPAAAPSNVLPQFPPESSAQGTAIHPEMPSGRLSSDALDVEVQGSDVEMREYSAPPAAYTPILGALPFGGTPSPAAASLTSQLTPDIAGLQLGGASLPASQVDVGSKRVREGRPPLCGQSSMHS